MAVAANPSKAEAHPGVARRIDGFTRKASRWPWSIVVVAVVGVIGIVRLVGSIGRPFTSGGDVAFLELQLRQAVHGLVTVGPYSRFGWHDPGPAMFYLYAPLYWLSGGSSRSLFLSSWLVNVVSALAAVAILRRRAGELAATVGAAAFAVYAIAVGFDRLIDPWNPSILALPVFLLAVSGATAATGWTPGLVVAAVTATFLVQTYIATLPVAAPFFAVAVAGYIWSRVRVRRVDSMSGQIDPRRSSRIVYDGAMTLAVIVVVLLWAAPLGQQIDSSSGNLDRLARFELNPPATVTPHSHRAGVAVAVVSDYATVVPLGEPPTTMGTAAGCFWPAVTPWWVLGPPGGGGASHLSCRSCPL
jgi:hypothetical protein